MFLVALLCMFAFLSVCLLATLLKCYKRIAIDFYGEVRGGKRNM